MRLNPAPRTRFTKLARKLAKRSRDHRRRCAATTQLHLSRALETRMLKKLFPTNEASARLSQDRLPIKSVQIRLGLAAAAAAQIIIRSGEGGKVVVVVVAAAATQRCQKPILLNSHHQQHYLAY